MTLMRALVVAAVVGSLAGLDAQAPATPPQKPPDAAETALRALVAAAPRLPPGAGATRRPGAVGRLRTGDGVVGRVRPTAPSYLLQRGDKADPVIAVDRERHRAAVVGQGPLRDAARHPRGSAGQRVDGGRRQLARHQVLARGKGAARHRRGRTTHALPQQLLRHDRHRVRRQRPRLHQRRLRERARPRVHGRWRRRCASGARRAPGPGQFNLPHSIQIDAAVWSTSPTARTAASSASIRRASSWASGPATARRSA